ncbi:MAG: hypothetical protein ABIY56_06850 [Dokdonella sp.]
MKRSRRHQKRLRLSIIVIAAMLWSQFTLAMHTAVCVESATVTSTVAAFHCHDAPAEHDAAACGAHCQNDQSHESGRVTVPPALAVAPMIALLMLDDPHGSTAHTVDRPVPVAWHWPTSHPAAILLI